MSASDYVEEIVDVLGGEDTEFYLSVKDGRVLVSCRYQGCRWGESCGEIELWEFAADAREHWEAEHANAPRSMRESHISTSRGRHGVPPGGDGP